MRVISVRLHGRGKANLYDPGEMTPIQGDAVLIETEQGLELGFCAGEVLDLPPCPKLEGIIPLLRFATDEELERYEQNLVKEKEAYRICKERIESHALEMRLVDVELLLDNKKMIFYFTSDGRVDFRELVKDLAAIFRTRIELRQIGVRDETRLIGGLGVCGRELCCCSFLTEFHPVSIKMAKEQSLSMNPTKISGACGRLLCCLKYEQAAYEDANRRLPQRGDRVMTAQGEGQVENVDLLRERLLIRLKSEESADAIVLPASEVSFQKDGKGPRRKGKPGATEKVDGEAEENSEE